MILFPWAQFMPYETHQYNTSKDTGSLGFTCRLQSYERSSMLPPTLPSCPQCYQEPGMHIETESGPVSICHFWKLDILLEEELTLLKM